MTNHRSFLKWAGGKYSSLKHILPNLPPATRLIEPFAGSGVVFINSDYSNYLLGELNHDLVTLFKIVQKDGLKFIEFCKELFTENNNTKIQYYNFRKNFNSTKDPYFKSALFLYPGHRPGSRHVRTWCASVCLDEAPEFRPTVLDALRQPLEHGEVVIARAAGTARFPARFQLVIASNPCPCGRAYGKGLYCTCTPQARSRYQHRLSGPIKDRIDIMQLVEPVARAEMIADQSLVEPSAVVAERVRAARQRQADRFAHDPWTLNAHVPGYELRRRWPPEPDALPAVESQLSSGWITARGADRVLRLAWTLADLAGRDRPGRQDVFLALTLRLGREPFRRETGRRGAASSVSPVGPVTAGDPAPKRWSR